MGFIILSFQAIFYLCLTHWSNYKWTNQLGLWSTAVISHGLRCELPASIESHDYVELRCFSFRFAEQKHLFRCLCSGGTLTVQDLASYRVTVTDAWAVPLGDYQMYIPPPPAGGVILSLVLNIMKGCCWTHTLQSCSATLSNLTVKLGGGGVEQIQSNEGVYWLLYIRVVYSMCICSPVSCQKRIQTIFRSRIHLTYIDKHRNESMCFFSTGYGLNSASLTGEHKTLAYHRYVEALKFANGLKKHIHPQYSSEDVRIKNSLT